MPTAQTSGLQDFEEWLRVNRAAAENFARRYLCDCGSAEDIVQDAALRATRAIARGVTPRYLGTWFHTIVRNLALNAAEVQKDTLPLAGDALRIVQVGPSLEESVVERLTDDSERMTLHARIAALPAGYRSLMRALCEEDLSTGEYARSRGRNEHSVRTQVCTARRMLKRL